MLKRTLKETIQVSDLDQFLFTRCLRFVTDASTFRDIFESRKTSRCLWMSSVFTKSQFMYLYLVQSKCYVITCVQ